MATQTTTTGPPPWLQPYLQYGLGQAQQNYQQGGTPVVPFSPYSEQAIQGTADRAIAGSPVTGAASDYVTKSLQGGFLGQNPYLEQTFNQAAMATQGQLASQFAGAGRNIDASQGNRSQQLNDLATQIYGGAYNNERNLQQQSVGSAIPLANQNYVDLAQLRGAGTDIEGLASEYAGHGANSLNQYLSQIGAVPAGSQTSQPINRNSGAGALGGALVGSQVGSSLSNSPWAGWLGAAAGGLLGASSDRRLKKNIEHLGRTRHGINVYRYQFIGSLVRHVGVMADEIRKSFPHAVTRGGDGYDRVVYWALPGG